MVCLLPKRKGKGGENGKTREKRREGVRERQGKEWPEGDRKGRREERRRK